MKQMDDFGRLPLDANFEHHRIGCTRCDGADTATAAGLAKLCLEGSILWKRANTQRPDKAEAPYNPHLVSKAAAKAAMRYK